MKNAIFAAGLVAWAALVGAGFGWLALYETRPGAGAAATRSWPAESGLRRDPGRWTLLLFLHPRCPCSRASLEELDTILSEGGDRVCAYAVFCRPPGVPPGWEKTATWRRATAVKGLSVYCDDDDKERNRFGPETSGHALLYDPEGRLRYSGGITRARGQTGDSPGRSAVASFLRGESPPVREGPVFGCPLVDPETPPARGEAHVRTPDEDHVPAAAGR
jgi:hypothetical protein